MQNCRHIEFAPKDLFASDPMKSDLGTGVECRASDLPGAG